VKNDSHDLETMKLWIAEQTALGPRRPGSPAGRQQEDQLAEKLASFGYASVRKEPIPLTYWDTTEARLTVTGPEGTRELECFPIPYTAFTSEVSPDKPLAGRLVWGDQSGWRWANWKGAIVVGEIRFPMLHGKSLLKLAFDSIDRDGSLSSIHHPATWIRLGWHLYLRAVAKGASGFIGILADQPGGSCRMFAPYGFREKDILDKPLPGMWVSREHCQYLKSLAHSGQGSAQLVSLGIRQQSVSHNVVAELPGESQEAMVLTCHHDSPFRSPVEDASGVSVVLSIAQLMAKTRPLKRRLIVLLTAGHFYGSIGTRSFIDEHRNDLLKDVVFALSIEHIAKEAQESANGELTPTGKPEPAGIFLSFNKAIRSGVLREARAAGLDRCLLFPAESPLGNYPPTDGGDWYAANIPIVNYISNPVYLLTDEDDDEWVDYENLPRVAAAFSGLLTSLDGVPRGELSRCDYPLRRQWMRVLRYLTQIKTTRFGQRPIH
jgi:hypothetical protein